MSRKINIQGTRFSIICSNTKDLQKDLEESKKTGYTYSDRVTVSQDEVYWLKRETSSFKFPVGVLTEKDYKVVLSVLYKYCELQINATSRRRHTYYYGPIEALVCFSGDKRLCEMFYSSTYSMIDLKKEVSRKHSNPQELRDTGNPYIICQNYRRYNISELLHDLVSDGASLIMDDSVYKYRWQGRTSEGFGNIRAEIEDTELYPIFKMTGIQGNQASANLSLRFDYKGTDLNGNKVEVSRNLMLVKDGQKFQDTLALRVSLGFKKILKRKGLIDCELPIKTDILVNLKNLPVSQRATQGNKITGLFIDAVCRYELCKKELDKVEQQIMWTQEERAKAKERSEASRYFWSLNKSSRVSSGYGKKIFSLKKTDFSRVFQVPCISQSDLRDLRRSIIDIRDKSYKTLCSYIYNYMCSKKSLHEFFGFGKKLDPYVVKKLEVIEPATGVKYNCEFKFV